MIEDYISQAARRYGIDPMTMIRIAQIESAMNPNAKNPRSSAGGLFQFIDGTAKQMGLRNRFDPQEAADAAARLAAQNAQFLQSRIGRQPTGAELYLAHQQGAGGAAKILGNPNAPAESVVGRQAVALNGGKPGMTAADFAALWTNKFNKGSVPTAQPTNSVAAAFAPPQQLGPQAEIGMSIAAMMQARKADQEKRKALEDAEQTRRAALFDPNALEALFA